MKKSNNTINISVKNLKPLRLYTHTHTHTHGYFIEDIKWKEFYIKDIFNNICRGKRLKKEDHIEGDTPYVSSTAINNGVDDFIGNIDGKKFDNCLTIANSGSVGSTFYHKYEFIASDHVTQLKNSDFNEETYLFLIAVLKNIGQKYSFNREINDTRIKKEKIMLPIDDKGELHIKFINEYIKIVKLKILKNYITYKIKS